MTEMELKLLVRQTVSETLISLGIDHNDPIEMQADFRHLREWRRSVNSVKRYGFMTAVGVVITGLLGAIWVGLRSMTNGS
jgi:hypothetical protein